MREKSTQAMPLASHEPEMWFQRAQEASTLPEVLVCLNQVYALDPYYARAREMSYRAFWRLLEADPFLAYQDETDQLYRVWSNFNLELIVPKDRAIVEPYPPATTRPLAPAFAWLRWTIVALLLAGVGALFLAPITAVRTLMIYFGSPLGAADKVRVIIILFLTALSWMAALFLSFLFLLHLLG